MAISGTCTSISDRERIDKVLAYIDSCSELSEQLVYVRKLLTDN